jgi:CHAT domain-containing protein/Tfp pilus assembly protein PilF
MCPDIRLEILKMANQKRLNNSVGDWHMTASATCIAVLLSALLLFDQCRTAGTAFAQLPDSQNSVQGEKYPSPLEAGKPIEQELAGGQAHHYKITIEAGQYMDLIVDQRGIDVVVTLFDPENKKLIEIDSPNGPNGPEPVSMIADASGSYRLEVRSLEKAAAAGRYEVKIADLRTATAQDRNRVLAEKVYADGRLLESQRKAESLRKAIEKYDEALPLYRIAGDRRGEAHVLNQIGEVHWALGEIQKALEYFSQSLPIMRTIGDRSGEAMMLNNIGAAYALLGKKQEALDYYNQSLPLSRVVGNRSTEIMTLNGLGSLFNSLGETQKALDYYNQALPLSRAVGDRVLEFFMLNNIGLVYDLLGEKQKALDYYNQARSLSRATGDRSAEASTLNNIGLVYDSLGEKQKALDYYNQSLPLLRAVGDRRKEAGTLSNLGLVYSSLGERQKALDYYNQALPLRRAVGDREGEAITLNNIGAVYYALGERQRALEYVNQALPILRAVGDRRGESSTLTNLGIVYDSLGEKQKALDYYSQALPLTQAVGDRRREATTLANLGLVYDSLGERQKALDYYNQALPLSQAVGDRSGEATVLLGIARAETAQGKLLDARSKIESALNIIESLRTKVVSPELRSSYFATAQDYYEFSISLLMQLHKLQPDRGYDRAALQTAERARARSLLDGLVEARLEIRSGADPTLAERERALRQLLNAKTVRQMRLLNGKHTDKQSAAVADEIKALTAQYQNVEAEIRAKSPRYAALTQPQPLKAEEIQQQVLDDQTLLLEYFLGKERSYLWVVSTSSVRGYELAKREDIEESALRVKRLLTARATQQKGESSERRQARIAEAEARYYEEAARLSRMILGPAISELSGKRLAIVPDGELQDVAFGALPVPQASGDSQVKTTNSNEGQNGDWLPLIAEHEIVSLPSASTLAVLRRETAGRQAAAKAVAVLADPVFDRDDERIKLAITARSGSEGGPEANALASSDLVRAADEVIGTGGVIPRLPFSRAEAEAILSVAPKETSLRALDFNASRATATSEGLSQYQIVHFATHGLLNKMHPELSGVVLSLVDREGKPKDGFLQLHDVYNLNLPAELVVLSACQTGLGKSVRGEGLIGLTRGFMYAGSRRVVASLWGVQDLATAELMKRFYGAMLGERRMRPAEALRAAQVEMWKQKRWRSPYYWGGFMLYGEWGLGEAKHEGTPQKHRGLPHQ